MSSPGHASNGNGHTNGHTNGRATPADRSRPRRVVVGATVGTARLVAAFFVGLSLISLVAFVYSRETKGVEMSEIDPVQRALVSAASPAEPRELAMNR
jgi:hypothetical protein